MRFALQMFSVGVLLVLGSEGVKAQTVDATKLGDSINLSGNWRMQTGDDMRWAQPDFDDSGWRVVATGESFYAQHIPKPKDKLWYRLHVKLPAEHPSLSLMFGYTALQYELYVNGKLIGTFGKFPPNTEVDMPLNRTFSIPDELTKGGDMTIAIRFYSWWRWELRFMWGGIVGDRGMVLGTTRAIDDEYKVWQADARYEMLPDYSVRFISLVLAAALLLLFSLQRDKTEYLWLAAYFVAMTMWTVVNDYRSIGVMRVTTKAYLDNGFSVLAEWCMLQFVFAFLRQKMPLWVRIYQISLPVSLVVALTAFFAGWINAEVADTTGLLWEVPYALLVPLLPLWRYLRGHKEAGFLFLPLLLINLNDILNDTGWLVYELHWRHTTAPFIPGFHIGPIPVYVGQIEGFLFVLSIGAVLLYRFYNTSQEQARALAELEAARSMQEVMLPRHLDATPGFSVEAVYVPAQEVGGDFYRIFPGEDGTLLVVIGDVSGKGVKAALLVSLTVGLLQKIAEATREPARVLAELNRSLAGHTEGRFATCCAALITTEGHLLVANAGHVPMYCNGDELDIPGGLPLGIEADVTYDEMAFELEAEAVLVFLSDGVVEARNSKTGELYGFERTRKISTGSADLIAMEAQRFGQEDDITVLRVELQPIAAMAF